jgi:hypothetical protein
MHRLLLILLGMLCSPLTAQARQVTIELENGSIVEGRVVEIDSRNIVVEVNGEQKTYSTEQAKRFSFTEVEGPPPKVPVTRKAEPQAPEPPATEPARSAPSVRGLWQTRMRALDRSYPWLFPAEPLQWISLGIGMFALLSLAVHFGARIAATEHRGFGRATGVGLWLLLSGVAQIAMVPASTQAVVGAVAGSSIAMIVLYGIVYGLSFGGALLATLVLAIEGGLGFALLQLVDATLRSIGNTTF